MTETAATLTAVTFALAPLGREWGVSIRSEGSEREYIAATGIEEHAPMDWTPDEATQLLRESGYEVIGEWEDIDHTGGEDPTWKAVIVAADRA